MRKPADRRWVRKSGTNWVGQLTVAFAKRLGKDMVEISYENAMKLRAFVDGQNKTKASRKMVQQVDEARSAKLDEAPIIGDTDSLPSATLKPETAEAAEARINEESGDDLDVPITDGLDDMPRKELFSLIDDEKLPVKKYGSNDELAENIRDARQAKPEPVEEIPQPDEPAQPGDDMDAGEPVDEDAPQLDGGAPVDEE